jgi:hypothetical protein
MDIEPTDPWAAIDGAVRMFYWRLLPYARRAMQEQASPDTDVTVNAAMAALNDRVPKLLPKPAAVAIIGKPPRAPSAATHPDLPVLELFDALRANPEPVRSNRPSVKETRETTLARTVETLANPKLWPEPRSISTRTVERLLERRRGELDLLAHPRPPRWQDICVCWRCRWQAWKSVSPTAR